MKKKKMFLSVALLAGTVAGTVMYFKKNPDKFQKIKQKMMCAAEDFEDDMMM